MRPIRIFPHLLRSISISISISVSVSVTACAFYFLVTGPAPGADAENVDWEAPTGGYLLQGCFATGTHVGKAALIA